ncbi:MAG TPA: HEAT repeat domain-containing protein, partial [Pyrinomonadaceae bacterium]|nr:HEAT repeat domain-containing protein [Pyrinomonadaceae bacterium]
MKNFLKSSAILCFCRRASILKAYVRLAALMTVSCVGIAAISLLVSHAQKLESPITVKNVSSQGSMGGTVVSIAADGSLGRAQTWQDAEGYHVVLPNTVTGDSLKTGRGVKVRRVGDSVELLLQTKPGTRVSVEGGHNQLNFVIDGKLDPWPSVDSEARSRVNSNGGSRSPDESQNLNRGQSGAVAPRASSSAASLPNNSRPLAIGIGQTAPTLGAPKHESGPPLISPNDIIAQKHTPVPDPVASEIKIQDEDEGLMASVFSGTSVLILISLGLFGLLVSRRFHSKQATAKTASVSDKAELFDSDGLEAVSNAAGDAVREQRGRSLAKSGQATPANAPTRPSVARLQVAGPTSLYGAYRIDQEVGKLLLGQPHRTDVLGSRAIDDRRAIETSLIKGISSANLEEKAQQRAREALEEYGFVARQCAALLLAPDAFERTSAARTLGEIKSPAALPFLLEGLYDSESIVRNQVVLSIGELKLPSAIGALLDIARMHPDVPSALLSRTLSACSVEGLDFFDAISPEPSLLGSGFGKIIDEITHLEPASSVEDLPESTDDERFGQALLLLESKDVQMRSEALKTLVQFRVQSAVDAISKVARNDTEPNLRSSAISTLGNINHESVFPAVLIGMADDSREVRASAARSLNRLSFDRADAYVRVLENNDEDTVRNVARACLQAGIVSQNLDRLSSSDHRQAYETFTLICLLTQANMNEPVLNAITVHPNMDVRLKVVHLLACTGHPATVNQLRDLAVTDGIGEEVKTAILEAIYKLEQAKSAEAETPA